MNAHLQNRLFGALAVAAAAALWAGACGDRGGPPASGAITAYRTHDGRVVQYAIAPEARLLDVEVTAVGQRTIVRVTTAAPIAPSGGPLAIDVHFSDGREVAFVRDFTYPCPERFQRAAVLDAHTGAVLGPVDVALIGTRLELAFDRALVTGEPRVAVSRYLPGLEALREAVGGLESAYATLRAFGASHTMYAAVPFAGPRRAPDSSTAWGTRFRPPPGTTNFAPTTPVTRIRSGAGAIEVVDHESRWPADGDHDTGFEDACGDPILCGWFTWTARVSFVGGCGPDRDGDAHLDGDEVQWYFGYCAFPDAVNDTWQGPDGYVHWQSKGRGEQAGLIFEYAADPRTGEVGVWYSDDAGESWTYVYEGPGRGGPGGWRLFPDPPPALPACAVAARLDPG